MDDSFKNPINNAFTFEDNPFGNGDAVGKIIDTIISFL